MALGTPEGGDTARLQRRLTRVAFASKVSAAIYGLIVSGAVMAAAGEHGSVRDVAITVCVTVIIYWLAESYADVLGEQLAEARRETWPRARELLRQGWPLVQASFIPLGVLLIAWAAGLSDSSAITAGLVANTVLLAALGWIASTRAGRSIPGRIGVSALAAAFGLVMIALKTLLH